MQKILLQIDSSAAPSVFDRIVAVDAGVDVLLSYGGVVPETVQEHVHGCIFTRGVKDLRHTAIFVGGSSMVAGERLLEAVLKSFFGPFQTSVMLDSNGSNTTAAAAVLQLERAVGGNLSGKRAVVMAGSGPVGSRAAGLLAKAGAQVTVTTRTSTGGSLSEKLMWRFGGAIQEAVVKTPEEVASLLANAEVLLNAGPAGVMLVPEEAWSSGSALKAAADLNAVPPLGIQGIEPTDNGKLRNGVTVYGALGVGGLKMKIHRAAVAQLFERNDQVFDAEAIAALGRDLLAKQV